MSPNTSGAAEPPGWRAWGGWGKGLEVKGPFMFCTWKQNKADYSRLGDFFYPSYGVLQGGVFFFFVCHWVEKIKKREARRRVS